MSDILEVNPLLQNAIETGNPTFLNYSPLPHHLSEELVSENDRLKDTLSRMQINMDRLPKFDAARGVPLTTETEQMAALLRKNGVYVGHHNDVYRVMTAEQSYMVAALARRETPRPEILEKLQSTGRPSIYEEQAFIETNQDAKLYRTRNRGNTDKVVASYKASEMLGARQATVRAADIIEGKRLVMEEYMLGARESTDADIGLITSENATTFLAHALLTEDLDWQSRNFVVNADGEFVRVDSKQIFVEKDEVPTAPLATTEEKQQVLKDKIIADPVMKAILEKADEAKVVELLQTFDTEVFKTNLQQEGIEGVTVETIVTMTNENIKNASMRLQEYKKLL